MRDTNFQMWPLDYWFCYQYYPYQFISQIISHNYILGGNLADMVFVTFHGTKDDNVEDFPQKRLFVKLSQMIAMRHTMHANVNKDL